MIMSNKQSYGSPSAGSRMFEHCSLREFGRSPLAHYRKQVADLLGCPAPFEA
jgi:hypothetical protein